MTPSEFIDDPKWADFLPEMAGPAKSRALPSHEDCSPLDVESAAEHLRKGGTLGRMEGYEERPGQIDMLKAIVRAFDEREHLMIEAGTGVGKSLAYLIPSMLWAQANDTPVVVSTATRNLQSQLVHSDIPRALAVLGSSAADFKVAVLKGRMNYLCLREVGDFFAAGYWTMSADEQAEMPHFIEWLKSTPDGDLDDYDGLPRSQLTCPGEECGGRRCPFYSRCFVYRARRAAAEADLIVVNHALVLADASSAGGSLLPAYGRLVLDEAHNLEQVATEYLSFEFSMPALTRLMNRMMRRGQGKRARPGGVLASVERQLSKGVLGDSPAAEKVAKLLREVPSLTVKVVDAADEILSVAGQELFRDRTRAVVRYREALPVAEPETRLDNAVAALVRMLHDLRDALGDSAPAGEINFCADLAVQVDGLAQDFVEFANEVNFVVTAGRDSHAFWGERVKPPKRAAYVCLKSAPLSVAGQLKKMLWDLKDSAILSSATLRVGNDFRYMAKRLGLAERFRALTADSPFDYLRQALVLAPDSLADPSADAEKYVAELAGMMTAVFSATRGRGLALFTSYEMMNAAAAVCHGLFAAAGLRLLVQGEGMTREAMTAALREADASEPTVVFGSQSFWEGVDVSGAALSCVVIARLPFAQVGDPIVEARGEQVVREGGSAFRDYAIPEAVIRFRQGFGRLIRSRRDRGVVVVTDPRIVTKNYGAIFRKSIPTSVHAVADREELLTRIGDFFAGDPE